MTAILRRQTRLFESRLRFIPSQTVAFGLLALWAVLVSGQTGPGREHDEGIPVTEPVVITTCGTCHPRDAQGNMQRISWTRATPEGWGDAIKQMILRHDLSISPPEARSIVKYLGDTHGLAPEEAAPVMYEAERRIHEETGIPSESLRETCAKCHTFARALSWHRSAEEWKQFADTHAARYNIRSTGEAVAFLAKTVGLRTPAWETWSSHKFSNRTLAGRWFVSASMTGHGNYYGELRMDRDSDDEYTTQVTLISARDGSRIVRAGHTTVFGGTAWRGRSKGGGNAATAPDDVTSEAREVLLIAPNQSAAEGRWFWGQYQEFGLDVKLQRAPTEPTLASVDRLSLKAGLRAARVRLTGVNFPARIAPSDLVFGSGVTVRRIVSNSPGEIVAELDVNADAVLGRRDVVFRGSSLPGAVAIYDRIDYLKVNPDSTVAAFGDRTHVKGYQQFEAIGYQRGPDGRAHTADDLPLGPVDVSWAVQVFHAAPGSYSDAVGTMSALGLFTPTDSSPKTNLDVWVIATADDDKDRNGAPLVGKSYMVVTVPTYTFNGRQYVRDLNRWVDDGPARP